MTQSLNRLLTEREVAELLNIGRSTIWRGVKNGAIPSPVKIGGATRWRSVDIQALIEGEAA